MATEGTERRRQPRDADSLEQAWRDRHRNPSGLRPGDPQLDAAHRRPASGYRPL